MTIGVISDTHMPRMAKALPRALVDGLRRHAVDLLVHCGDIVSESVVPLFEELAAFDAVAGNNDPPALVRRFSRKKILEFGAVRIGVVHGDGAKSGLRTPDHAFEQFRDSGVHALLFGHSHIPYRATRSGMLLFNPGSPTDKRMNPRYSYGILRVNGTRIDARHYYYWSKSP
ncbi:MAG: metallophosphoesterase [Candidatus Eremiobacteraeota bacterium]|nr:metallophosphoesterase [Candidatus Eremiobacteraeota bacterium]